jgi:hypothetical protein
MNRQREKVAASGAKAQSFKTQVCSMRACSTHVNL